MFYEGDLNSGISLAVSQSKYVACFVHDDSETSKTWEEDFLTNADLPAQFEEKVVFLKLRAGSQEAEFLGQIAPIFHVPTFVLLGGGLLKVYIPSNPPITKEDFTSRVQAALQASTPAPAPTPAPAQASTPEPDQASTPTPSQPQTTTSLPTASTSQSPPASTPQATSPATQQLMIERAQRLATDKLAKEKAAAALAKAKAEKAKAEPDPAKKANLEYAKLRSERLRKDKDDLAKVRKRVEDDKIERKAREQQRKERDYAVTAENDGNADSKSSEPAAKASPTPSNGRNTVRGTGMCAIQIRLFDGSTIRSRFPITGTLDNDIRPWIKQSQSQNPDNRQATNIPYTFKQVLTPLPNRTISISEESMELRELGLVPSATLILVPVQGQFAGAYEGGGGSGINIPFVGPMIGLVGSGLGLVGSGVGAVVGAVGGIVGAVLPGGSGPRDAANPTESGSGSGNSDPRRQNADAPPENRENREFYNGNNLSFEPRRDEDEDR